MSQKKNGKFLHYKRVYGLALNRETHQYNAHIKGKDYLIGSDGPNKGGIKNLTDNKYVGCGPYQYGSIVQLFDMIEDEIKRGKIFNDLQ